MCGRGDAWQRARVFILLARQQQLDAVMLAIDERFTTPRYRPWLPAVLIGGKLYLFDTALGLPIPCSDGQGVATLEEVLADDQLLRSLDVGDRYRYPVSKDDLDRLVFLFDAAPESLSQRMKLVEAQLTGEQQMELTTDPSALAESLLQRPGVSPEDVRLWGLPYETFLYHAACEEKGLVEEELRIFTKLTPLVRGRQQHFRGQFEDRDDKQGAKSRYMEMRIPQEVIDEIETNERVQRQFGLSPQRDENPVIWQRRLAQAKALSVLHKQYATYWMALAHYEGGNYEAAVDWLKHRVLEASPEGPWTDGARYNLARCYEVLGERKEAIELYRIDDSPQRHGNRLRARWLEQLPSSAAPATSKQTSVP
jgi:hypothetical protein